MRTLLLYTSLLVLVASLISCQRKDDGVPFESILSTNDISRIVIRDSNLNVKEIINIESINKWINKVGQINFIRDENQEERDLLLIYDGCLVKAFHQDEEIADFKLLKFKGVYYKENVEFDKQVELLCKLEV
ncbi:hypothetical protein [Pradoshia sp.]